MSKERNLYRVLSQKEYGEYLSEDIKKSIAPGYIIGSDRFQIILESVPEIFPYMWRPETKDGRVDWGKITKKQRDLLEKVYGPGIPIGVYGVSYIIRRVCQVVGPSDLDSL